MSRYNHEESEPPVKMNNKPKTRRQLRTAKTIHRQTNPLNNGFRNASKYIVFIVVQIVIVLTLPSLVTCDTNLFNEIDNGDDMHTKNTLTELSGGKIIGEKWLRQLESPYTLQTDLMIERTGKLFIEPGVTVRVAPMVGIIVRGVLTALGTATDRIIFTAQEDSGYSGIISNDPKKFGARLVDGPSPLSGRLQMFYENKWRSVCTNSRNWTIPDYEAVCRQMGFQGGKFWNWVERLSSFESRMLYEEPNCHGVEGSVAECAWNTIQIGSGVCDYHNDIGVQCLPLHETSTPNWRGIYFENAPSEQRLALDNTIYEQVSLSELRYVDIVQAGSGIGRSTSAAVEVIGMPPSMNFVTIDRSAFTGINVTRPDSAFTLNEVTVQKSRGIGIFVNSSNGLVLMNRCKVNENGDDGIKYIGHDLRSDERTDRNNIYDFCTLPTTAGQTYPISVSVQQSQYASIIKECAKYFFTRHGYLITVNFVHFVVQNNETASIEIFDGSSASDRLIATWALRNYTRPQSVTSTREKIFIRFRADPRSKILGYLRLSTGPYKSYDLNVTQSIVSFNGGRGIGVDNLRSQVHVHESAIMNNGHVAGIHVTSGAGDINVTQSRISFNDGDGINVTYYGGNRNFSRNSINSNAGQGIAVWLNQTFEKDRQEFVSFNQTSVIEYTTFFKNLETGILHGNFCSNHYVNVTGNRFNDSLHNSIDIQSCWFPTMNNEKLHLQIGHNVFENDKKISLIINPALNLDASIEYNHFQYGKYGSILIRNKALDEFRLLPARLMIHHNQFFKNQGIYVVSLGLTPYTDQDIQYLLFTRNFVRMNKITEPFLRLVEDSDSSQLENQLSPRSRVAAPVVISSSNVEVFRNIIHNKESRYEVGSQVADQSQVLNVTYNWLGHKDEEQIFHRLFHRKDRYDLAKIEYLPYLLHNSNPGANTIMSITQFVPRFYTEGSDIIGGEVDGQEILPSGTYTVDRDINIRPGGKLVLYPGSILNFAPSVGMMVSGKLEARGRNPDDIFFTLKKAAVMTYENETTDANLAGIEIDTEPIIHTIDAVPKIPIRLLGGANDLEGRLQVYLNGKWGTVCDYGWNMINAALVCHQLGFALNPTDWQLQRSELPNAGTSEDVLLSHVQCTEHDIDITQCRAERASNKEFLNSCSHVHDVGIRCYESAWAGVRFGMLAESTDLQYVTIEKAGLFDYATNMFKPALQMDFARHNLENVRIVNNLQDGLGIVYSDIYGGAINTVKNSEFSMNRGSGISLKQLGLRVQGSIIKDNLGPGISHTPVISANEQRELAGWFSMAPDFNIHDSHYHPFILPQDSNDITVDIWTKKYLLTSRVSGAESIDRTFNIHCPPGYVIGFQLLNPIQNGSTENIWIYDSQTPSNNSNIYELKRDLTVFPVTSSSYGVMVRYQSGKNAFGGVVIVISSITAPIQNIYNRIVRGPPPTLYVTSTKIQRNQKGLMATYYNRYLGDRSEHFLRKANESIKLIHCEISHNKEEAIFVLSPFWDVHVSNISEVTIHLNNSLVISNGRGIRQYSKDLRSSNNLFHYVIQGTTFEDNLNGGLDISLPYVWQYNENFTHSVYLGNDTWIRNKNFGVHVTGHFAVVNITGNTFKENECLTGLIGFRGMEKKLKIDGNQINNNNARYIIEFRADSLSEILGEVHAIFAYNKIANNHYNNVIRSNYLSTRSMEYDRWLANRNPTCVIGFGGIQKVRIYRNLLVENKMQYDLIAGVRSARLNNFLDATENWWSSTDVNYIHTRIFDFDDWNNHAEVLFRPFLLENNFDGSLSTAIIERRPVNIDNLGGRIFEDLTLYRRGVPYVVNSDITVMPAVTLTIHAGTEFEFAENVGILVLGTLIARGFPDGRIQMRSQLKDDTNDQIKYKADRQIDDNRNDLDSIRLCKNGNCSNNHNDVEPITDGFLEYFNHTTLQWVPICDRRFTERNAQVVCRELGFSWLDVYFNHDQRLEYHTNSLTRIWSWVQPLECKGDEAKFSRCIERLNGQLYGHRHECKWHDKFVFVSCNGRPETRKYWAGIRFANSEFESSNYEHRIHDIHTHTTIKKEESFLEFIDIDSAGMLHGEKSAAIQTILKSPIMNSITITNGANHGVNLVSPSDTMHLKLLKVENVFGQGINAISLSGEGRESDESSFTPLKALDLPYHLFSFIDICDTNKEIIIEERVILYYKYDNDPVNCVKIFNSAYRVKPLGFRLLQANLFNHSKLYGRRDSIQLFDGDLYNLTAKHIDTIEADSNNEKRLFRTITPILSVRLIASGAPSTHGFFAEVVTLPASAIGFNRDAQHNISLSEISGAVAGAVTYSTAGEISPRLTLENNRIINNCRQLYGNFSTCDAAVKLDVQNMQTFHFQNNLVKGNQGGVWINADSRGSATSLRAFIHHNLFVDNRNRPSLYVEGRQSSPYQEVTIFKNYFSQNRAAYADVIALRQVVSNFSYNYVHSNRGGRIIEISGFDKVRLPIYQTTSHNGFYDNVATDWRGRATIVAGTAGQQYVDNIFYNPDNDYEMITVNRSIFEFQFWNSTVDLWKTRIDATHNYWNYNDTLAVSGRIRDKSDDPSLLEVAYFPYQLNNKTILDDKCPPGWNLILDTCYKYVGAPMTFFEARDFCRSDNATMPFIRGSYDTLWIYLQRQMIHQKYPEKIWIQDLNYLEQCTSFIYRNIEIDDCNNKRGFVCEIDPKVVINPLSWQSDIVAVAVISAFIFALLLLFLFGFCWCSKSHHRHVQRLQRRNSIRQSLRSLNAIDPQGSLRRRNYSMTRSTDTLTKSMITTPDYKKMVSKGSIDSMDKSVISSNISLGGYDPQIIQHKPVAQKNKYSPTNSDMMIKTAPNTPQYDAYGNAFELSYRNEGFRDNSTFNTRNNSYGTNLNDDTPIVHHTDMDDTVSDYYGKSSTLPIRQQNENLQFLTELKNQLPEYEQLNSMKNNGFMATAKSPSHEQAPSSFDSFTGGASRKPTSSKSNSPKDENGKKIARKPGDYAQPIRLIDHDGRRPDSYYTAMQNSRDSRTLHYKPTATVVKRPKAVYESSAVYDRPIINVRSKSEALLEANFDDTATTLEPQMKSDSKSYSQPMETAM